MSDDNTALIMYILNNTEIYEILEYLYINRKIYAKDVKEICDVHKLDILRGKKLVDRVFWKRGTYVGSVYAINGKGKYIFELVSLFNSKKKV